MNLETTFEQVELGSVAPLRDAYLDGLPHAQVLKTELMLRAGETYAIRDAEQPDDAIGYFVIFDGDTLLEFHLSPAYWVYGTQVLAQVLVRAGVRKAWVKSYDALLFSSCLPYQTAMRSLGWVGRDFVDRDLPWPRSLLLDSRRAEVSDLPRIMAVDQPVFRDAERLRGVIAAGCAYVFESEDELVAFGIVRPIVRGKPEVEVGIAVDRPFRKRGLAVYILRALVDIARQHGHVPVGSVADDNPASTRMAARIGFVARHALLELTLEAPAKLLPLYVEPSELRG